MSELCEKFCPAYQQCRAQLNTVITYSSNLQALKQELETAARDHGVDDTCSTIPELIEDMDSVSAIYSQIRGGLRLLRSSLPDCDGPMPDSQGLLLMKDALIRKNTDEQTRQSYIYRRATCANPVGVTVLRHLPAI